MKNILFKALGLLASCAGVAALTPAQWRSQTVYQVLTDRFALTNGSTSACPNINDYCGGTFQGIINHLDYIQSMGFTAIWISPVVENVKGLTADGNSYHGYWARWIDSINSNFGTPSDLQALSSALHSRGMYLMVDVVTNHMGYEGCGTCVDYSIYDVFNNEEYYHPYCPITNYNDPTNAQTCWEGDNTVSLPDLKTENSTVAGMWNSWITALVSNYSIDGLRIDSCIEVDEAFFPGFVSAAGVYAVCEAFNGDPTVVCPYQSYVPGMLNYPAYYWVTQAFESTSGSISNLYNGINTMKSDCADTTLLGSFLENHDNPRFPSYTQDYSLAKNAVGYVLLADGIPIIYEGQEQHYSGGSTPNNRETIWTSGYSTSNPMFSHITTLNTIRKWAIQHDSGFTTYKLWPIYQDSSTIATRKGTDGTQMIGVFSNLGSGGSSYTLTLSGTGYTSGQQVMEIFTCTQVTTDSSGNIAVPMASGLPRVFYPVAALAGSGICGQSGGSSTTSSKATSTSSGSGSGTSCTPSPTVAVTFNELVNTTYGETIKISGNTTQLGSWDTSNAVVLSASEYTSSDPLWYVTLNLPAGQAMEYKFINVASSGTVTWEDGSNRVYTVPTGCSGTATVDDTWQ